VASVFTDITERRRAERRLRHAANFDAFRVALNDALRPLEDPAQIQSAAARLLGLRIDATRVYYAEVESKGGVERLHVKAGHPPGAVDMPGVLRLADVGGTLVDELRAGRIVIVPNVDQERRFTQAERAAYLMRRVRAFVELPLVRHRKLLAILSIQHDEPRAWTPQDVACIEETAQRTWAAVDRARAEAALRAWELRLQKAFSIQTVGVLFFDLRGRVIEANAAFERMSGFRRWELIEPTPRVGVGAPRCAGITDRAAEDLATRGETAPYEKQLVRKDGTRWWGLFAPTRLAGSGSESECVEFVLDITQSKKTQEELRRAREDLELRVRERTAELAETNASLREQIAERQRAEAARQALLRQLVNAQEDERRRISRELHDELGQQVSALSLKLSMLRQQPTLSPELRKQVESIEKIARDTDNGLDFLVWQLRPTVLDDLGLAAAVRDHVTTWSQHFGIECSFHVPAGERMRLDPEVETVLYRAVQEALNNIAKHARAGRVEVRLERGASHASVTVIDDGVGFDPCPRGERPRGLGLVGMRERASFLGGDISIASKPGEGTRIKVDVPLPSAS
jgi:PAS domain S-box-containing protein